MEPLRPAFARSAIRATGSTEPWTWFRRVATTADRPPRLLGDAPRSASGRRESSSTATIASLRSRGFGQPSRPRSAPGRSRARRRLRPGEATSRAAASIRCGESEASSGRRDLVARGAHPEAPMSCATQSSTALQLRKRWTEVPTASAFTSMPVAASSARIDGPETFAAKYANHPGDCQCVMPGITTSSRSASNASNDSGASGAATGSFAATSPGATSDLIGRSPTRSM